MNNDEKAIEVDDEMRSEYDFRKLKFVGRGIYAERYRAGVRIVLLDEDDESESESIEFDAAM